MNNITKNTSDLECCHLIESLPKLTSQIIHNSNIELFSSMSEAFYNAEKYLKLVEIDITLDIPSLNELRYVGFHMLKAMKEGVRECEQAEELRRAKRHCERACYDAVEIGVLTLLNEVGDFQRNFQSFNVTTHLDTYHDLLTQCETIRDFISSTSTDEKPEYYQKLFEHYVKVRDIKQKLDRVKPSVLASVKGTEVNKTLAIITFICLLFSTGLGILTYIKNDEVSKLKVESSLMASQKSQLETKMDILINENSALKLQNKK